MDTLGYFIRYDEGFGSEVSEDIMVNAIPIEDLDDTLMLFYVKDEEAIEYLSTIITQDFVENIGSSVMVLNSNRVDKVVLLDVNQKEEIHLLKSEIDDSEVKKISSMVKKLNKRIASLEELIKEKEDEDSGDILIDL